MNQIKQLAEYDFHDSLLEDILYDESNNKVCLKIDFCNWKQKWYSETDEETTIISVVFSDISDIAIPKVKLNSDEIIEFEVLTDNSVKIVIFNDIDDSSYDIMINAESVEIIK